MRAFTFCLASLLGALAYVSEARANPPYGPYCPPVAQAPDACGPGYYVVNRCGAVYGPNYNVYPWFPPVNGPMPSMGSPAFKTHRFARGPRDYFMLGP